VIFLHTTFTGIDSNKYDLFFIIIILIDKK
jgi:hypothetical protein